MTGFKHCLVVLGCTLIAVGPGSGQDFGSEQIIDPTAGYVRSAFSADLDGDGDPDVLSASWSDDEIAWYENFGNGSFGAPQVLSSTSVGATSVRAFDLDGDGDLDVLSSSELDGTIAWFANLGGGVFGPQQLITTAANGAHSVFASDLDGDGDADVLSAAYWGPVNIAWYENLGAGTFSSQKFIANTGPAAHCVHASDLDGDGDPDVLYAVGNSDTIGWSENLGGSSFGPLQVITDEADSATSVFAADLDGDGDADVLSASGNDSKIAWYENLGSGTFGPQQVLTTSAEGAWSVYAQDLDLDGDMDVLSASWTDEKIAWYENLGGGSFGPQLLISSSADGAFSVYAADLTGDGYPDVLSASGNDTKVVWYENLMDPCPKVYCTPKANSVGCTPSIGTSGSCASLSGPDDFIVRAANVLSQQNGIMIWSLTPASTPFGGGVLCLSSPVIRTPGQNSSGSPPPFDCTGTFSFHFSQAYMQQYFLGLGDTVYAQFWSRDPGFLPPENIGLTGGLTFSIAP